MTRKKLLLVSWLVFMFVLSMFATFPVTAWVYPNGSEDNKFELYGPHVSGILIKLYANLEAELNAMDNDLLDFEDQPLPEEWVNRWQNDSRFQIVNYAGEGAFYLLDINNNETLSGGSVNPCTVQSFRRALAYLVNRTYIIVNILGGNGLPVWTPVPPYLTPYVHPEIKPGGALENLTYGGMTGDIAQAEGNLTADGFLYIPAEYPWRFWDKNINGHYDAGEEFSLIFYTRSDSLERLMFADYYYLALTGEPIKIDVDYRPRDRATYSDAVYGERNFHLCTPAWLLIDLTNADYLYSMYHSSMYPSPNYNNVHDPLLDYYLEEMLYAPNEPYKIAMCWKVQERFAEMAFKVPLWSGLDKKAFRRTPVNELPQPSPTPWKGVVNEAGFGGNSKWTFLNLMKECEFYPPIYVTYGFSTLTIDWLNPFYAEWYWEWEILNKLYDSCGSRNPYDIGLLVPQLAKTWEIGTWRDPITMELRSKLCITLRPDLYWQDGTPLTKADLAYTFVESIKTLLTKGLILPWWYPTAQHIISFCGSDPLNIEILLDTLSIEVVNGILSTLIIPKHIWKPIVDASTPENNIVHEPQPDPYCIGSGPFRFVQYIPEDKCELVANTPGNVVHGITSPGYWQYCPVHVNIEPENLKFRFDPGYPNTEMLVSFSISLHNLWLNQSSEGVLIVDKHIFIDGVPHVVQGIPLLSCHPDEEFLSVLLTKCKHEIKVAVHIVGPSMLDAIHPNPWLCQWINVTIPVWITIKQDIAGAMYLGKVPAPDCKVDGKDIAFASSGFGAVPGMPRWNCLADVNGDYKIDGKDIANIAKMFGRW
jgi:ABC-type transport system substrate-binding protein